MDGAETVVRDKLLAPGASRAAPGRPARTERDHDELNALLERVQQGCRKSFALLYDRTSPQLFSIIVRINGDRGEAEEVLQEVYVLIWRRCAQFDAGRGQALHWLLGIAHNTAISSLRYRGHRPQIATLPEADDDAYAAMESNWPGPPDIVIRRDADDAVRASLQTLPSEQRECLLLAFFDGLSHNEIAERTGHPLGTVKSRVRRSLAALRPLLCAHA